MNPKCEIRIVGRRLNLTDAIKAKVEELADKLVDRAGGIDLVKVELEVDRHSSTHSDEFSAKGLVVDGRDQFFAFAEGDDLYLAISDLETKLDRILRRRSRKRVALRRRAKEIDLLASLPKQAWAE